MARRSVALMGLDFVRVYSGWSKKCDGVWTKEEGWKSEASLRVLVLCENKFMEMSREDLGKDALVESSTPCT